MNIRFPGSLCNRITRTPSLEENEIPSDFPDSPAMKIAVGTMMRATASPMARESVASMYRIIFFYRTTKITRLRPSD